MAKKLLHPDAVRDFLTRRYENQHQSWLAGGGIWPLSISLGAPTEKAVADNPGSVRDWVNAWSLWSGPGEVVWASRHWPRLGSQRLPVCFAVSSPEAVAVLVGQSARWLRASERFRQLIARWPALARGAVLASKFCALAEYSSEDFERLVLLLGWLEIHPASNLYLRQLPVHGIDTKWVGQRSGIVADLARAVLGAPDGSDFHAACGLRKPPDRMRMRVLCPDLRKLMGGLRDIEAPVDELADLPFAPAVCLVVENLESGLALPDLPAAVCIMKLGNAVSMLGGLPWMQTAKTVYWGDIDTHGFAILDRARRALPRLQSVLMDEATLLMHRTLCGTETVQCPDIEFPRLQYHERLVYEGLRSGAWGRQLRLEQERLPWAFVLAALKAALDPAEKMARR